MGATELFPDKKSVTFQAESDFEIKMAVASLFWIVFELLWVKMLVKKNVFSWGDVTNEKLPYR